MVCLSRHLADCVGDVGMSGSERVEHLRCESCGANPSYAIIDGEGHLVCHCTHVDGVIDPKPARIIGGLPAEWDFVVEVDHER